MRKFPQICAFLGLSTLASLAQTSDTGVAVDQAGPMPPPDPSTKIFTLPPSLRSPGTDATPANITYTVTFADPNGPYASYYPQLTAALQAAGAEWNKYLVDSGSIEVMITIDPNIPTENGASATSGFVRNNGTRDIYEQGAAYELRTGIDPNGATPDVNIRVGAAYLTNTLWFDPDPSARTAAIPANKIDAISVFIHELGHAYCFNGYANTTNGQLPATYESTFDVYTTYDGANLFFTGPGAMARYGGPVPLTYANSTHIANAAPRPGSALLPDLMNGVVYNYQTRYYISPIDLEIARDTGLNVKPSGVQLINISTRLGVQTGENVLIGGFIVTGHSPKRYVLRGIGPSLGTSGVAGTLADPILELHQPDGSTITNNNWRDTQAADLQATGIAPTNDNESAILATLAPGNYTAVLRGNNNGTGIGLVEGYDLDSSLDAQLANISTRGFITGGDNVLIGGVIAGPTSGVTHDVLIRGLGPELAGSVSNPLADPTLELHDSNGALIQSNDDWKDTQQTAIAATGIPPTNDKESAILASLSAGNYTAIVRGKGDTTGVCLVEVYRLP